MRVMVTGHKGYIGTVMVPLLEQAGHSVLGLDTDLYRNSTYGPAPKAIDEIIKDVREVEKADFDGVDAVVHLAALSNDMLGDLNPDITYDINHRASVRIAAIAKEVGIQRFVFASSCSMYGASEDGTGDIPVLDESAEFHPVTAYATSKVLVEQDVRDLASDSFSPTFMRNATAFGMSPRLRFDVVVNNLTAWAYTTGKVHMKSDGSPWRPLVHIGDISRAVVAVLDSPREVGHNESFNVGRNQENYQIREVAQMVKDEIPGCDLSFAEGAGPDLRNYRVTFDKYTAAFPNHPLTWTVAAGAKELHQAYQSIGLGKDDYEGTTYKRIAQLKQQMADGNLDETMRWIR